MEAICSSETSVTIYKETRRHNPEDHNRHFHIVIWNVENRFRMPNTPALPPTKVDPLDAEATDFSLCTQSKNGDYIKPNTGYKWKAANT
jgi:hypothetical protein